MIVIKLKDGINLHFINTDKFKTVTLCVYIRCPLTLETATVNALVPYVLQRGCKSYPDSISLSKKLDELYGAKIRTGVIKKGDLQYIVLKFEFINDEYAEESVFSEILSLAKEMVFNQPVFCDEYVKQEKENLKSAIAALINDKRIYAANRCREIMFENSPYGIGANGFYDKVDEITTDSLYKRYKEIITENNIDIFVCGKVNEEECKEKIENIISDIPQRTHKISKPLWHAFPGNVKKVVEQENITQGKLSIGFVSPFSDYPTLLMFNAIFGSGPTSKLFNNVREKLSLAYYASSSVSELKGIMTVNSGIECKNFSLAYDEIMNQLDDMKKGKISDDELNAARLGLIDGIRSITDSPSALMDYKLSRDLAGDCLEINELIERIKLVKLEDVIELANGVVLDTVYFLEGVSNEN